MKYNNAKPRKKDESKQINRPAAVDLFSGAGGLSEGFTQAGFFVALAIENDAWAAQTYRYNHCRGKNKYRTDMLKMDITQIRDFAAIANRVAVKTGRGLDVVIGGPPCQGFSRANIRARNSPHPLNNLVLDFIRAVRSLRPRIAVMENVADIERCEKGLFVQRIESAFAELGYYTESRVLTATDYGVPQYRRRFFLIATREGNEVEWPKPTCSPDSFVTVWDAISDLPLLKNGDRIDKLPYKTNTNLTSYQFAMRKQTNGLVQNNHVSENADIVIQRYRHIPEGGNWQNIPDRLMSNYSDKSRCHHHIYRRLKRNEPSIVITHYRKSMLVHPTQQRGLSVREAARLQSFPDYFVFQGPLIGQQQQVANAVPPLLAKAVARCVKKMLKF